ncbi:MAG: hypothetical protein A4E67_00634 [Syntrophaceae bacterium PtaB.Bin038]|jgi:hypothetical protein|nr:MAG: hypothetical protein A4E67_00634 [Syntrophaceae bacterium PtaB.Bin038]
MFYMDFWTAFAFVGTLLLVVINAILVMRMDVDIHEEGEGDGGKGPKGDEQLCRTTQA